MALPGSIDSSVRRNSGAEGSGRITSPGSFSARGGGGGGTGGSGGGKGAQAGANWLGGPGTRLDWISGGFLVGEGGNGGTQTAAGRAGDSPGSGGGGWRGWSSWHSKTGSSNY